MTKTMTGCICMLALLLCGPKTNAFEHERAGTTISPSKPPVRERVKRDPCAAATKLANAPTSAVKLERGKVASEHSGVIDILVVDEADNGIDGFTVRVNRNAFEIKTPLPPGLSLKEGEHVIEVEHADVGKGCKSITIKSGDVAKIAFQFFRLREEVTQLKTTVFERQYYGSIIFLNPLGDDTEIFVDLKDEQREQDDFDDRASRGGGSLKITNLAVGRYELEVKLKAGSERPDNNPFKCAGGCRTEVTLEKCETAKVQADQGGLRWLNESETKKLREARSRAQRSTGASACDAPPKRAAARR